MSCSQEVEFDKPITNVEIMDSTLKGKISARRGWIGFIAGMAVVAMYYYGQYTYNPNKYVIISQEAYYDLHKNQNMFWHSEKRCWVRKKTLEEKSQNTTPSP